MKKLTQKKLLELWKKHKKLKVFVNCEDDRKFRNRVRFLKEGKLIIWSCRSEREEVMTISCFEIDDTTFEEHRANPKNSIRRMFQYDKCTRLFVSKIKAGDKIVWEFK
jgi:hypothetical protein